MAMRYVVGLGLVLAMGCSFKLEVGTGTPGASTGDGPFLPDPEGVSGDEPVLDAVQQMRKAEADQYIAGVVYKGAAVFDSVILPSGDVLDFIDRNALPALSYSLPALPFGAEAFTLPEGVQFGLTELEQNPELLDLAAIATPFRRPNFWPYILGEAPDAASVEDYLERYQEGGAPSAAKRLYAGVRHVAPNRGMLGYMNQFRPEVEDKSFSLIEFAVSCPAEGPTNEQIGIVISVDRYNSFGADRKKFKDGEARMHIEYARKVNGKVRYVWDGLDGTFVDNPFRLHQPGEVVPVSLLNKMAVEHLIGIFQVTTGDWWIVFDGDLLGYYPASLFTSLAGGACRVAWYGEVLNTTPNEPIMTEMGSGQFAEAGLFKSAYVRNPKYYTMSWFEAEPKDEFHIAPYEPLCYNRTALTYIGAPTNSSIFLLGGPGAKNPGCKWP